MEGVGGREEIGGPAGAGAAAHPVYWAGDRHSSHNIPSTITNRSRHTGHSWLTLRHALRPAAAADLKQGALSEHRVVQQRSLGCGICPSGKDLRTRACRHRQAGAHRHGVAEAGRGFCRTDADSVHSVTPVELDAFSGYVTESGQDRVRGVEKWVCRSAREL